MPEALAFDMYGTLVDLGAITDRLASHVSDATSTAQRWRETQLRYATLLTAMDRYEDFGWVTARALDHALAEAGNDLDAAVRRELAAAFEQLPAHPDTLPALERLRAAGHTLMVFSNGTRGMIESVLAAAGVGRFKPAPEVYRHAAGRLGRQIGEAWLVSANPFDVIGAASAGMRTAWVDRTGAAFDPLGPKPELVVHDLGELAGAL